MTRAIKGFDANFQCRGFQFEVGQTYAHDGDVIACKSGFHAIPGDVMPLCVFDYYPPAGSRFAVVEVSGEVAKDGDKIACAIINVQREIGLHDLALEAAQWVVSRATDGEAATNTGDHSAATNTGYRSAATNTGYRSAATNTGYQSAATNTGNRSAATNTGNRSAATNTGYHSAATNTGDHSAATNTGDHSAATNTGYQSAATNTGYQSAATNTGNRSAATNTGDHSAATNTGKDGIAIASGIDGKVMGAMGVDLVAREFALENGEWVKKSAALGTVGENGILPDVWYVCKGGKLVAA